MLFILAIFYTTTRCANNGNCYKLKYLAYCHLCKYYSAVTNNGNENL